MGVVLSASMVMGPVMQAMAANQFSVEAEDVGGKVLFPGDSVSGIEPIYMGPDGNALELTDGSWKNETSKAFSMSSYDGEGGGLWLEPKGYVLTVKGGTSKAAGTDGTDHSNHFKAKDENADPSETPKDIAFYDAWTDVTVTADAPKEGMVFDHWEVENANVTLADAAAAETNFTMVDAAVTLNAVYAEAPTEPVTEEPTEAPTEAPAEMQTEAPAETQTEATVTVEPETEAPTEPATEASVYDDGLVVIGGENGAQEQTEENVPSSYTVTVENGSGSGDYELGTEVQITADAVEGMTFVGWTTDAPDIVWFADSTSPETTFSMPAQDVNVTATYMQNETQAPETDAPETDAPEETGAAETEAVTEAAGSSETETEVIPDLYTVTVENAEGEGTYEAGATVTVYAQEKLDGQPFAGWTASENVVLDNPQSPEASFVMPAGNVEVKANYAAEETEPATEAATEAPVTEAPAETPEDIYIDETEAEVIDDFEDETEAAEENGVENETDTIVENETEAETELTAAETYRIDLSSADDITVSGAAVLDKGDGMGSQIYAEAGATVTMTAEEYEDQSFQGWIVTRTDETKETLAVSESEDDYLTASFTMPNSGVYIEAVYEVLTNSDVQVINGSGSGTYTEGDYVEIQANDAPEGQRFKKWTVITGDVELDDETADITGFTMPAEAVQVKAVYEVVKFTLTVNNGSGSGSYTKGETINLTANYPSNGKVFAGWQVTSKNASVAAADRYYSSMTMPAANVTLEATYKDGPSPDYNEIQGIVSGGEYLKGQNITFTAVGNGMGNSNPNPGDYRFRPTGYQIGSVNGSWNNYPYTTTMAINAVGQYTLNVTYAKDVFDGNNWVADGSTVSRSVTFNVVNALSVQTGDSTPIVTLIVVAAVAMLAIILLLVIRIRRRR